MFKKTLIALGAVTVLAAGALPALANTDEVFFVPQGEQLGFNQLDQAKAAVTKLLDQRGIKATDVDEWGGYIRADVTLGNGEHAVRFFEPGTLAPVGLDQLR